MDALMNELTKWNKVENKKFGEFEAKIKNFLYKIILIKKPFKKSSQKGLKFG